MQFTGTLSRGGNAIGQIAGSMRSRDDQGIDVTEGTFVWRSPLVPAADYEVQLDDGRAGTLRIISSKGGTGKKWTIRFKLNGGWR